MPPHRVRGRGSRTFGSVMVSGCRKQLVEPLLADGSAALFVSRPRAADPAQFRGCTTAADLSTEVGLPGLRQSRQPQSRHPLIYDQFRYAFANAVSEEEAKQLYETYAVATAGKPLFQAAAANFNPWTEAKVDTENPERGPLLLVSGELAHTGRRPSSRPPTNNNRTTKA
jgi:hypothetical protein